MKRINGFFLFALSLLFVLSFAGAVKADTLYLTNGSTVHGKIIETLPNGSIKIKKDDGETSTYKKSHVKRVVRGGSSSEQKTEKRSDRKMKFHTNPATDSDWVSGVNSVGRPGFFYSDTAYTPNKGQWMGSAGIQFYSLGSQLIVPVGGAYGVTPDLQVHANTSFYTGSGVSGLGNLVFGAKYHIKTNVDRLNFAGGLDLSVGPLTGSTVSTFNFDPYGVVSYAFQDELQLNAELGVFVPGGYKIGTFSYTPPAYIQFNAGASYPVAQNLIGIAELDVNGLGSGNTPLIAGVRTGKDIQLQGFGGLDLAGSVGIILGGNVAIMTP